MEGKTQTLADAYQAVRVYVDALTAAAGRCRRILVVLAVASVLFFVAYWNSRDDSWPTLRLRMAQACLYEGSYRDETKVPENEDARNRFLEQKTFMAATGLLGVGIGNDERRVLLERDIQEYRRLKKENIILVRVPFFQVVFDVNDLGVLSGITFTLLLLGYWFSVTRERDTLKHAFTAGANLFKACRIDGEEHTYHVLSTSQVLNVPDLDPDDRRRPEWSGFVKKYVAKLLVVPPLLIQLAIIWNDQSTIKYGSTLSEHKTSITLTIEGILFFLILVLTIVCTIVSLDITRIWDDKFIVVQAEVGKRLKAEEDRRRREADEEGMRREKEREKGDGEPPVCAS
jgi:hypothetical protein